MRFDRPQLIALIARSGYRNLGLPKQSPRFQRLHIATQPFAGKPFLFTDEEWQAIADRLPG